MTRERIIVIGRLKTLAKLGCGDRVPVRHEEWIKQAIAELERER